jgi:toluene monooxygenase system ferredoxin subunit
MTTIFICKKADIQPNGFKVFEVDGEKILVAQSEGEFYAYDGICPHQEGSQLWFCEVVANGVTK